jgi:hypothetical protein
MTWDEIIVKYPYLDKLLRVGMDRYWDNLDNYAKADLRSLYNEALVLGFDPNFEKLV